MRNFCVLISLLIFFSKCESPTTKTNKGLSCEHGLRELKDCESGSTSKQSCESRGCCYREYGQNSHEPWCSKPACSYVDEIDNAAEPTNCEVCFSNYHLTEDTKICRQGEIDNYYLDNSNKIYRKCHSNCLRCVNGLNQHCKSCQANYYLTEDINACFQGEINFII